MNKTTNIVTAFNGVLKSFVKGTEYKNSPPIGPPEDLAILSDEELESLKKTTFGEDLGNDYSYDSISIIEEPTPKKVPLPTIDDLQSINVCGIDGSNQRVERSAFYFILARAAIIEFRYSIDNQKPYFYNKLLDKNAVVWVDGNVFKEDIKLQTIPLPPNSNILNELNKNNKLPFLVTYSPQTVDKSPGSHALGWAVKLQQALELECLKHIPTNIETVCIKDGPLFSTSVSPQETIDGLNPIFQWKNQVLICSSKRVKDSRLLVEAIQNNIDLRNFWFPNQNITDKTIQHVSTDSILLPRILHPGFRTPLMEAVPRSRKAVVSDNGGEPRLTPLTCYYLSRHKPYTYIRIEIPKFMWERDKNRVNKAISIVAWQHELGHKAPLVQMTADIRCQVGYEKDILEKQTLSYLYKNGLNFPENY
jgi:hypothetical protein